MQRPSLFSRFVKTKVGSILYGMVAISALIVALPFLDRPKRGTHF